MDLAGGIFADASAALGIIAGTGLGKVGHLRCHALWLQEVREEKRFKLTKIPGEDNPSDAGINTRPRSCAPQNAGDLV